LPGGSCCCQPDSRHHRWQGHAGLAGAPSQSSVFLYRSRVNIAGQFRDTQPLRQESLQRNAMCGQERAKVVPYASRRLEFGELGIRRAGENELPTARSSGQQPNGSRRPASRPISPGRSAPRSGRRVQPVDNPGCKERAPCRNLAADRFEASHSPSPVAGGRQPRPRSHDHGHAVHLFIALPAPPAPLERRTGPRPAARPPGSTTLPRLIQVLAHARRPTVRGGWLACDGLPDGWQMQCCGEPFLRGSQGRLDVRRR
jgi:hypothetical protein